MKTKSINRKDADTFPSLTIHGVCGVALCCTGFIFICGASLMTAIVGTSLLALGSLLLNYKKA